MSINFRSFVPHDIRLGQEGRPVVNNDHQSARPGLFICGDLAGNPTLKTSIRDGYESMRSLASWIEERGRKGKHDYDVVICGAGGAGLAAALEAQKLGLKTVVLEKTRAANTVFNFSAGKKIWARQEQVELDTSLWLDNCTKEELLEKWRDIIRDEQIHVQEGRDLKDITNADNGFVVSTTDGSHYTCAAVLLAIGRSGNPRTLRVPGEDQDHVHHMLLHPSGYAGKKILVVGGGNSAIEAANALIVHGAQVRISYRQEGFFRITAINRQDIEDNLKNSRIQVYFNSQVTSIQKDSATLAIGKNSQTLPADEVFVLIGADPPKKLLSSLGVTFENSWPISRFINMVVVFALVWFFYAFAKWGDGTSLQEFPFGLLGKSSDVLPRWLNPGLLKTLLYTLVVISFGIPALVRWRGMPRISTYQTWRYVSIVVAQAFFLFIFPEFIIKIFDQVNYWRFYGVVMPFPLVYEIFFYRPPVFWIALCAGAAFVALPVFVYWHGKRLCSWICGCGCLSETLGDRYRHYAPQGDLSRKIEMPIMWVILIWAAVSAVLFLVTQGGTGNRPWYVSSYSYLVDFWLAAVIGIGTYFFLGNRIWCRYFCPLAHYMRLLSAWYGKFRIKPADRCIACGECSRYCQMGIDVMKFALKDTPVNNRNSSCIGCGVCVSVCPMDNLTMGERFPNEEQYLKLKI
ncbi:MAG: NAD(P)-binding domain-containing protein [Proteobacteria bacterium]|nr:NAD(P)-binding domain-containing protein [Pseudomonadota bacterium]